MEMKLDVYVKMEISLSVFFVVRDLVVNKFFIVWI